MKNPIRFTLKTKLLSAFLFIGLLSVAITGWQGYRSAGKAMKETAFNALTAVREAKKRQIETYFQQIRNQALALSQDPDIIKAAKDFKRAFHLMKEDAGIPESRLSEYAAALKDYYEKEFFGKLNGYHELPHKAEFSLQKDKETIILQYHYIVNNPGPTGMKDNLAMPSDGSEYSVVHAQYHPLIKNFREKFGFYDIFLADDKTGRIVYSVFKEVDFATCLVSGPSKDTNLAKAFEAARNAPRKDFVKLMDFEFYAPSYQAPAAFMAAPIFDGNERVGVLLFQLSMDGIDRVMTGDRNWEKEGLGKSGETYIVGSDQKMRSDSRFFIEGPERYAGLLERLGTDKELMEEMKRHSTTVLFQDVHTEAVEEALKGRKGTRLISDYRNVPTLSSYAPLDIEDVRWAILSEMDVEEAFSPVYALKDKVLWIVVMILTLVVILGLLMAKTLSRPIFQLIQGIDAFGKGDLSRRVPAYSTDEIGLLADSFNRMAENLLRTTVSRDFMDNILSSMAEALLVAAPPKEGGEGKSVAAITMANPAAMVILGYEEKELLGQPLESVFSDGEGLEKELIQAGFIRGVEKTLLAKNGRKIPVLFSGSAMRGESGDIRGIVCVAQDNAKQKKTEEELRKFFRGVEQNPASIMVTDTNGNIEYVNPQFTKLTGYSFEEAMGKNPSILQSGKTPPETYKLLWGAITSRGEWRGELCNRKKNGEFYWEQASISPVKNEEGMITHFLAVKEDITERKRMEDALLLAKEEAENTVQLKDKFVSLIAHDIRSPFTTILGFLKLIVEDRVHPLHENHLGQIKRVIAKGEELLQTTGKLLEMGSLKTGKMDPEFCFIDAHFTASSMAVNLKPMANLKEIELVCNVPRKTGFYADPDLFSRVMENLLTNAIKFCNKGGKITIFVPEGEKGVIAVRDTGAGIREAYKPNLFKYEEKTSDIGTSGEKGTGLGLPLCQDIMKAHGGTLEFESEPGKGTVFLARLPDVRPLIMVVDDDPGLHMVLQGALKLLGVEILEAKGGKEAVDKLEKHLPHLIISDIVMPGMDGFGLLSHVKKDPALKDIPVIMMTADNKEETRNKAFLLKADDFLGKPIIIEDLMARVKKHLRHTI